MKNKTNFILGLDAGLFGRCMRLIFGVTVPLYILVQALWGKDLTFAFYLETLLWFVVIFVAYLAAHYYLGERLFAGVNPWISTAVLVGPVILFGFFLPIPPEFQIGLALYIIISLVFNFVMSYGGCEVMAIPSLIFHRRYVVYCPWNAVDVVDKVIRNRRIGDNNSQMGDKSTLMS